jgi:hypothetical protein
MEGILLSQDAAEHKPAHNEAPPHAVIFL